MTSVAALRGKYRSLAPRFDEHTRRIWAATEANALGRGGASLVSRATGISRRAILVGQREIDAGDIRPEGRVRRSGGGRKSALHHQPDLLDRLEGLVEPLTRGDPMSPLRWTCKSTRMLSRELAANGYSASSGLIGSLLHDMGYSLQCNFKTVEGKQHPDRNAQFEYINKRVATGMRADCPVISVDTKKKEMLGITRITAANGTRRTARQRSMGMTFPSRKFHAPIPMASMTSGRTPAT